MDFAPENENDEILDEPQEDVGLGPDDAEASDATQREPGPEQAAPDEPDAAATPADHEAEVEQADDAEQMPEDWAEQLGGVPQAVKRGDIVEGVVVAIDAGGVICDVGAKTEGIIPISEFASETDHPGIDDHIEVAVVRVDEEKDVILLSKRRADYERCWNELEQMAVDGGTVEAMVTERVKGGLRVDVGVPGFVPASHVATRNLRNLDGFVGRSLRLKVLEADRRAKKVILSHRELVDEERARRRTETLDRLHEGAIVEGKVRNIRDYGAFVDLGGIDGLLHISEMSWTRTNHPSDIMKVGDKVRVVVLEIAADGERISLGMRQILPDPWKETAKTLRPGSVVKSRITRVVRTGAFAQLVDAGIEGFIPIREMSEKRISEPDEAVSKGQDVELKILDINVQARRMTLSLVAAQQEKERREYRDYMQSQQTERPTLGDQFGDVLSSLQESDDEAGAAADAEPAQEPPEMQSAEPVTDAPEPEAAPEASPEAEEPDQ